SSGLLAPCFATSIGTSARNRIVFRRSTETADKAASSFTRRAASSGNSRALLQKPFSCFFCQPYVICSNLVQFLFIQVLEIEKRVVRAFYCADHFIHLDMHRFCIPVLSVLNQEYHQECYDRRSRINYKLPSVAKAEERPAD